MELTRLQTVIWLAFHLFVMLPLSSAKMFINGTRGGSGLWQCNHTFTQPFQPEDSLIYWQTLSSSVIVAHVYARGKEEFKNQADLFKNRTKIFPDQLRSGNFSLVIESLQLRDDQTSLEVIFITRSTEKLCQVTLHVSAPFHEPKIDIYQKEKTAICSTTGGYPRPEVTWSCRDHAEAHERPLEPVTHMIPAEDGTFTIRSKVNITGLQNVTCSVYNPTSRQTLSVTKDITPEIHPPGSDVLSLVIITIIVAITVSSGGISIYCRRRRRRIHIGRQNGVTPEDTGHPLSTARSDSAADSDANR